MSLKDYRNRIAPKGGRGERLLRQDRGLLLDGTDITTFGTDPNDVTVKRLYSRNNVLLDVKFDKSAPVLNPTTGDMLFYPRNDIREFGYTEGAFKMEYLFWRYIVGNSTRPGMWVQAISPSRTEVKVLPTDSSTEEFNTFKNNEISEREAVSLIEDVFFNLDTDTVYMSLRESFRTKLKKDFQFTEADIKNIINQILSEAIDGISERLVDSNMNSLAELNTLINTILKEKIAQHLIPTN